MPTLEERRIVAERRISKLVQRILDRAAETEKDRKEILGLRRSIATMGRKPKKEPSLADAVLDPGPEGQENRRRLNDGIREVSREAAAALKKIREQDASTKAAQLDRARKKVAQQGVKLYKPRGRA